MAIVYPGWGKIDYELARIRDVYRAETKSVQVHDPNDEWCNGLWQKRAVVKRPVVPPRRECISLPAWVKQATKA